MSAISVTEIITILGIAVLLAIIFTWAYVQYLQSKGKIPPKAPHLEIGPPQELGMEADEGPSPEFGPPQELRLEADEGPRFTKKYYFFTYPERKFYEALLRAVGGQYQVFSQVRMADVIYISNEPKNKKQYNYRLRSRHFDFLLCDPAKQQPRLAVELDDSTHKLKYRQESDEFKNYACKSAGLPLLRMKANEHTTRDEIIRRVEETVNEDLTGSRDDP